MIIDANNLVLGRLGTYVAKKAMLGEKIDIVNCESLVVAGKKESVLAHYNKLFSRGIHSKGPRHFRSPERFVKRSIRGMLPYKKDRGMKAFKNIKCHTGVPENLKSEKAETLSYANVNKLPNLKYVKVKDICTHLGYKAK